MCYQKDYPQNDYIDRNVQINILIKIPHGASKYVQTENLISRVELCGDCPGSRSTRV